MKKLLLVGMVALFLLSGCAPSNEEPTAAGTPETGGGPSLGAVAYTSTFPFEEDFGGDTATVAVDVKELGFTFTITVTSATLFVCEISQAVIEGGQRVDLDSNQFSDPLEFASDVVRMVQSQGADELAVGDTQPPYVAHPPEGHVASPEDGAAEGGEVFRQRQRAGVFQGAGDLPRERRGLDGAAPSALGCGSALSQNDLDLRGLSGFLAVGPAQVGQGALARLERGRQPIPAVAGHVRPVDRAVPLDLRPRALKVLSGKPRCSLPRRVTSPGVQLEVPGLSRVAAVARGDRKRTARDVLETHENGVAGVSTETDVFDPGGQAVNRLRPREKPPTLGLLANTAGRLDGLDNELAEPLGVAFPAEGRNLAVDLLDGELTWARADGEAGYDCRSNW